MAKARRKPNPAKDRCSECGYLHCGLSHQVTVLKAELRYWKKLHEVDTQKYRKALEGLTNAALAGLAPLQSQIDAGFEALKRDAGEDRKDG